MTQHWYDILKQLRIANNYTQQDIADILGVTKAAISKYEKGLRRLKPDYVEKLSKLFNVEPLFLLIGKTTEQINQETEDAIAENEQQEREYWESVLLTDTIREMMSFMDKLNSDGKQKVLERIEELTEIPKYRQKD